VNQPGIRLTHVPKSRPETENVNESPVLSTMNPFDFDEEKYPHKNKIKILFTVMKRKFGESLEARIYRHQVKEIKLTSSAITAQELSLLSHF